MKKEIGKKGNKNFIVIILLVIAIIVTCISTSLIIKHKKSEKTVNIAFYGLSDEYINLIKNNFPKFEDVNIKYTVIADEKFEPSIITQKFDLLFTWKGEYTNSLEKSAEDIPAKALENLPSSLKNKKCLPLLLDHWELDFCKDVVENTKIYPYVDFHKMELFLVKAKSHVFVPFFIAGSDDRTLLAFITSIIEAKGGLNAYYKFIEKLQKETDFSKILDADLGKSITLRAVLDDLKKMPSQGLTHPNWYYANQNDVTVFTSDNQVGVFYTNLATHRKMDFKIIKKFETSSFPRVKENDSHGIIAPTICGMLFSTNSNAKKMILNLIKDDVQSQMSTESMLAPVHVRAEAYDSQADDVRFWAASCEGGALPDPALAVYQKKPDSLKTVANEIRSYLKSL